MRHSLTLEGYGWRLRPVALDDAAFMLRLRTDAEATRFLNPVSVKVSDQQTYLENYFERPGDYYFIIENHERQPEGMVAIYDEADERAEWGRWILRPGSMAALESAWLVYEAGFKHLGLSELYCRTVAANEKVVAFHDRFGLKRMRVLESYFERDGQQYDSIEHQLKVETWPALRQAHLPMIRRLAERVA